MGDEPPVPVPLAVLSVALFCALGVLTAVIEVLLVPLRMGGTIFPVTVLLAVVGNAVLPVLSRAVVDVPAAAVSPVALWVVTVVLLSQSRPEGDLLLPAIDPLIQVTYVLLGAGAVGALAGVRYAARPPVAVIWHRIRGSTRHDRRRAG